MCRREQVSWLVVRKSTPHCRDRAKDTLFEPPKFYEIINKVGYSILTMMRMFERLRRLRENRELDCVQDSNRSWWTLFYYRQFRSSSINLALEAFVDRGRSSVRRSDITPSPRRRLFFVSSHLILLRTYCNLPTFHIILQPFYNTLF